MDAMKPFFTRTVPCFAFSLTSLFTAACDSKEASNKPATSATVYKAPVASVDNPLPPLKLKTFKGLGVTFKYPEPYVADTATTNPVVHQVALDHKKEPGVLTLRFNPKAPSEKIDLDDVAEATRQRMGVKATVEPSQLKVGEKSYDARLIRSNQLGLIEAIDVVAVVPMGERNYVILTHTSNDDQKRAQRMFDTVLSTLARN